MIKKPNILIICTRNKKRSRTAEYIFKNDSRFNIRSAGLSPKSERKITEKDVNWSDFIFVMESKHKSRILEEFKNLTIPKMEILNIPDDYEYLDDDLIELLKDKINSTLEIEYNI